MSSLINESDYYTYPDDINLDEQSLYDYVTQQIDVQNLITNVTPENENTFGQTTLEGFDGEKAKKDEDKQISNPNYLMWAIILLLIVLAFYILFRKKVACGSSAISMSNIGHDSVNEFNYADDVATEFKPIFVK